MTAPVLIAQITDLHIKRPGEKAYGVVDTAAALSRCIDTVNRFRPRPATVVITGDLVDTALEEEYAHLTRLLAPLELPFLAIPGNHDARAPLRRALPSQPYAHPDGPADIFARAGGLDLLLLNSSVPGKPHGLLEPRTLAWLEAELRSSATRPALIFLHHPPFVTGIEHMDVQNLHNAPALEAIVRRHPRARLVAAGHVHRAVLTQFAGIAATIAPAPNHAVALDLEAAMPPSFTVEPPAFHLHAWFPGAGFGEVVTHQVPIGEFAGPHPFFDADGRLL